MSHMAECDGRILLDGQRFRSPTDAELEEYLDKALAADGSTDVFPWRNVRLTFNGALIDGVLFVAEIDEPGQL